MTNEEAIKYLRKLYMIADITDEYGDLDDTEPYETAIDLAIDALETKKMITDCIKDGIRAGYTNLKVHGDFKLIVKWTDETNGTNKLLQPGLMPAT